jgi:hypothetical protein
MNTKTFPAAMALLVSMTTTLAAQSLTIDRDVLTQGSTTEVSYSDPSRAGKTIVVVVSDGGVIPSTQNIYIALDANGNGSVIWEVPAWSEASFTPPSGKDITLPCLSPSGDGTAWTPFLAGMQLG